MKQIFILALIFAGFAGCAQTSTKETNKNNKVGGPCEGCEAIYESPIPLEKLKAVDTLPDFDEPGQKIKISGIVYEAEGKTPAKGVVIYVYHTDQQGIYPTKGDEKGWGKRHGYIRGWMKTDEKGYYEFYTLRPASYPNSNNPQHIHVTIKEPQRNDYWIDDFLFEGDPYLTKEARRHQQNRGGDGIIKLTDEKEIATATRNIYLGKNIPDYK